MNNNTNLLPIPQLIDTVEMLLKERGYKDCMKHYRIYWNRFIKFCEQKEYEFFTEDIGMEFFEAQKISHTQYDTPPKESTLKFISLSIRVLGDYQLHGTILRITKPRKVFTEFGGFNEAYSVFLKSCQERGLSEHSIRTYSRHVRSFITFCRNNNVSEPALIIPKHITDFSLTLAGLSNENIRSHFSGMRYFLNILYLNELINENLSIYIPRIKQILNAKIPSVWSKSDVEKLLSVIDRGSPKGKRDYAILTLISHLGLRASDIRNLKLNNLNWNENAIEIIMHKTNQILTLPITDAVGESLIDYLKYGRPKTPYDNVFITHNAPFNPFSENNNLGSIIEEYRKMAKIQVQHGSTHGVHSLRHTLASVLLEQNISLPVISDVLGHLSCDSTKYYLKVDINKLRECAISMEEVLNNE